MECLQLYRFHDGEVRINENRNIFRTIIPLKGIATQKVGRKNVPHDVPHDSILKNRLSLIIYGDYYYLCHRMNVLEWRLL